MYDPAVPSTARPAARPTVRPDITVDALVQALTLRDLTEPAQGAHALQLLLDHVVDALTTAWRIPAQVIRTSPLVAVADNYDQLGYPPAAVTRDRRYSRYVSPTVMLRSHTSAGIPAALRTWADRPTQTLLVLPGLVYRRDVIDATHVGEPHQVDLWRLQPEPGLGVDDLLIMVAKLVEAVLPGAEWRAVPTSHPYTTNGHQIDVRVGDAWLELAECGLLAPQVAAMAGLDPARCSGLALGMGLDRALMLRKEIPDIRLLRSADPRVRDQLTHLDRWRPVSTLPPIRRDLSLVVAADLDAEVLGDRVRSALGEQTDDLESVELLSLTPYVDLPPAARDRLQLRPDQANALVRMVIRPIERTLTDAAANALRNRVYLAVHDGPVIELAG